LIKELPVFVIGVRKANQTHDVADHKGDDGWRSRDEERCFVVIRVDIVGIVDAVNLLIEVILVWVDSIPPLDIDKNYHVADKTKEYPEASDYIKDELLPLTEVDHVQGLAHNTEVQVEVGNDDREFLLDIVGD